MGGTQGIGFRFLEETFNNRTNPKCKLHQRAARAVLKTLLPESGTDIKGQMKSYGDLLQVSGYAGRPRDFNDLLKLLDSEIRLITPTDPLGSVDEDAGVAGTDVSEKYYQLTHDYLVRSLRDWLTYKQNETRRGRADLKLTERAMDWNAKQENRRLPGLWFRRFQDETADVMSANIDEYSPTGDSPQIAITWYEAAAYCNWLSKKAGIPQDRWIYQPNSRGQYAQGMTAKHGYLQLNGYRLPTEAEWEYSCRAGTLTSRYYGSSDELLEHYAVFDGLALQPVGTLKPNAFGLFDSLGNVYEYCHDGSYEYDVGDPQQPIPERVSLGSLVDTHNQILRGGSFRTRAPRVRAAKRINGRPTKRAVEIGFRVARSFPQ